MRSASISIPMPYLDSSDKIMSERFKVEKEEGREEVTSHPRSGIANDAGDPVTATTEQQGEVKAETRTARLSEKLQMINRISSYANNMTLISLSMHMVYLGLQIQVLYISVLYNMRQFVKYRRLKQFALRALASTLDEEELVDLRDQFRAIDADKLM